MRTELVHSRWLLCGGIIPNDQVKPGQVWASASGNNHTVAILSTRDDWVEYMWTEHGHPVRHEKLIFAFQCRYCLVLPTSDIPKELQ